MAKQYVTAAVLCSGESRGVKWYPLFARVFGLKSEASLLMLIVLWSLFMPQGHAWWQLAQTHVIKWACMAFTFFFCTCFVKAVLYMCRCVWLLKLMEPPFQKSWIRHCYACSYMHALPVYLRKWTTAPRCRTLTPVQILSGQPETADVDGTLWVIWHYDMHLSNQEWRRPNSHFAAF